MKSTNAKLSNLTCWAFTDFRMLWKLLKIMQASKKHKFNSLCTLKASQMNLNAYVQLCICSNFQGHLSRRRSDNSEVNVFFSNSEWDKIWTIIINIMYVCIEYSKLYLRFHLTFYMYSSENDYCTLVRASIKTVWNFKFFVYIFKFSW